MHPGVYIYRSTLLKIPRLQCSRYCIPQTAEPTRKTTASAVRILPKTYVTNPIARNTWPIDAPTITKPYFDDRERSYNSELWSNVKFTSTFGMGRYRELHFFLEHRVSLIAPTIHQDADRSRGSLQHIRYS